jgi:hypothetical protein
MVGMATVQVAWGAAGMRLRGGVEKRRSQGWRSPVGGRGRWQGEIRGREGLTESLHRAPPSPRCQLNRTRRKYLTHIPLVLERRSRSISFLLLVGLQEKKRDKEERKGESNGESL